MLWSVTATFTSHATFYHSFIFSSCILSQRVSRCDSSCDVLSKNIYWSCSVLELCDISLILCSVHLIFCNRGKYHILVSRAYLIIFSSVTARARSSYHPGQRCENAASIENRWHGVQVEHVSQGNNHKKGIRFQTLPPTINSTNPPSPPKSSSCKKLLLEVWILDILQQLTVTPLWFCRIMIRVKN